VVLLQDHSLTPPQLNERQEKIITDEHSGRILVDAALADEERENGTTFAK
jgi:hypothetical protein